MADEKGDHSAAGGWPEGSLGEYLFKFVTKYMETETVASLGTNELNGIIEGSIQSFNAEKTRGDAEKPDISGNTLRGDLDFHRSVTKPCVVAVCATIVRDRGELQGAEENVAVVANKKRGDVAGLGRKTDGEEWLRRVLLATNLADEYKTIVNDVTSREGRDAVSPYIVAVFVLAQLVAHFDNNNNTVIAALMNKNSSTLTSYLHVFTKKYLDDVLAWSDRNQNSIDELTSDELLAFVFHDEINKLNFTNMRSQKINALQPVQGNLDDLYASAFEKINAARAARGDEPLPDDLRPEQFAQGADAAERSASAPDDQEHEHD